LPVGGIKEKILAARRAGIRSVVIPHSNAKDLVDIPEPLKEELEIQLVQGISEALRLAFESPGGELATRNEESSSDFT
jgi:ATP-dependent Lon protease